MFIVTFVIMLPIALKTNDPVKGWEAGLTWVFVQSFILMAGGFVAPLIRRITPRAALLGTLAGVSITFISMRPALEMFVTPVIGIVCFAIILASWFGGVRYGKGIPAGLVAIAVGTLIAWARNAVRPGRRHERGQAGRGVLRASASRCRCRRSTTSSRASSSSASSWSPRSRSASTTSSRRWTTSRAPRPAGDAFPTTRVLTADGVVSLIGCLMGNPFINAVYIGHPGWKAMGGRIGYSAAIGVMVIVLSWFGIISLLLAIIPVVAISPILLYIGMLICAQAFQTTPDEPRARDRARVRRRISRAGARRMIDGALGAAGTTAAAVGSTRWPATACSTTGSRCWAAARSWPAWCWAPSRCS